MEQKKPNEAFVYTYSAKDNAEIEQIRRKYLPQSESKLEELKRLDAAVQKSGVAEALTTGIGGMLLAGLGMCLSMQIIANGTAAIVFGVLLSIVGFGSMLVSYPTYRKTQNAKKKALAPRILELASELAANKAF